MDEETTLIVPIAGVLANDSDADSDPLTAQPGHQRQLRQPCLAYRRIVQLHAPCQLLWHRQLHLSRLRWQRLQRDGHCHHHVEPVNDAPVADDQLVGSRINGSRSITLTASDVELDPLTYAVVTGPAHGTLTGAAPNLIYTPDTDYQGLDSFTFRAHDDTDPSNLATVTIDVAVNHLPEAIPQAITLDEDSPQAITLSGTDLDADLLSYHIVDPPQNGTLSGTVPDLVYTPNADYYGWDAFTFLVNDGTDDSLSATVSLTIRPVNDQPQMDFVTYLGGTGNEIIFAMALADDGYTFVTGQTNSVDLPNSVQAACTGAARMTALWPRSTARVRWCGPRTWAAAAATMDAVSPWMAPATYS